MFTPAFNVAVSLPTLLKEFDDVAAMLERQQDELKLLVLNDNSSDETGVILDRAAAVYPWLSVTHNRSNLGNAANIVAGYTWGSDTGDVVGCLDADGEHSPYALLRHIRPIRSGTYDGVSGSIIFPEHDTPNHNDRNMMRFYGGMQSTMAGVDGQFYIQSPGYNLHRSERVTAALKLLDDYKRFFATQAVGEFPRWGMHGVMIHLLSRGAGAKVKAVYLECFGRSPNRTEDKLVLQARAAQVHLETLAKFLPRVG